MRALIHVLAAAILVTWLAVGLALAASVVGLAIAIAEGSPPQPPRDRGALVILHGDTGHQPAETALGEGGPAAGVRPLRGSCRSSSYCPLGR